MLRLLFVYLFIYINLFAQIDTSDYYPLHVGDKWQYFEYFTHSCYTVEVTGDTIMPNGQKYYILPYFDVKKYQRVVENRYVRFYTALLPEKELIMYDLYSPKGTLFWAPLNPFPNGYSAIGIFDVGDDSYNLLGENLEWRDIRQATIYTNVTPPDTIWDHTVDAYWPRITQGIGVTAFSYGMEELIGAVINKVGYGTLSGVKESTKDIPKDFELYQNYPNPFNPSTFIRYSLKDADDIKINIYNVLGKEIKTLYKGFQTAGEHTITFIENDLPCGIYFVNLVVGENKKTIKALLLK